MARRTWQWVGCIDAVAVETRLHSRLDGPVVHVRLDGMARSTSDRIRYQIVFGVVEDQGFRTVTRPDFVDVGVTLGAPGERRIADHRGGRCWQLLRCSSSAAGTTGGDHNKDRNPPREHSPVERLPHRHVLAPSSDRSEAHRDRATFSMCGIVDVRSPFDAISPILRCDDTVFGLTLGT
jgi:hypothetical protein